MTEAIAWASSVEWWLVVRLVIEVGYVGLFIGKVFRSLMHVFQFRGLP